MWASLQATPCCRIWYSLSKHVILKWKGVEYSTSPQCCKGRGVKWKKTSKQSRRGRGQKWEKGGWEIVECDREDEGHTWRGPHFPSVAYSDYPSFRTPSEDRMVLQQGLSAAAAPPSIQTPRDSITPWWAGMENQSRGYGKQCVGAGNHTDRQSAMMKRLPSLFLLSDPACPPASPSSPTALCRNASASWPTPTPTALSHTFLLSVVSPGSMYLFTSSHGEQVKQRWIFFRWRETDGFWIEVECNLWLSWSSADL